MVSVVIPMYNSEQTIVDTLNSIKNQTYKGEIEIIVVNDGSVDKSKEIVNDYIHQNPELNILLINQENRGVSVARNNGLKMAKGKYFAFIDSDDEWHESKTAIQIDILKNNPHIDFLGCARNNEEIKILFKRVNKMYKINVKDLFIKMFPQTSTVIFKRELFDKYGGFDESMTHAEDGDLWIRYCNVSNFYYIPESLVTTGKGKPSFGFSGLSSNMRLMHLGYLRILKKNKENGVINNTEYYILYLFYILKYIRRIVIKKLCF
jgi:glycosyltransferase involved in cell wall biosynthesis